MALIVTIPHTVSHHPRVFRGYRLRRFQKTPEGHKPDGVLYALDRSLLSQFQRKLTRSSWVDDEQPQFTEIEPCKVGVQLMNAINMSPYDGVFSTNETEHPDDYGN